MKEEISFYIPKPCHENWDNMTPEGKGRFCASCSKQVVDFSLMSDKQVLNYFKEASGKVCGRFANDQLQRPMQPVKEPKKKSWWYAAMMPLLLLFNKADAQKKNIKVTKGEPAIVVKEQIPQIMGKVSPQIIPVDTSKQQCTSLMGDTMINTIQTETKKASIISGKITDSRNGEPIAFASVVFKNSNKGTSSDLHGNFSLKREDADSNETLMISSVGFVQREIKLSDNYSGDISLGLIKCDEAISGEVVVVGYSICPKKVKKIDTIKTSAKKIFSIENFKLYPNPIAKGNALHIQLKTAGEFSIQLLDNNSRLIAAEEFTAATDNLTTSIDIPSSLAAGMYYVRVIDEKKKKQYTDKIIVQ